MSENFTQIQNEIIRTDKLDVYQKSCINNILSNDNEFRIAFSELSKRIPCSKVKCINTINSLKELNIISVNKVRTLNGDWDSNCYKVNLNELLKYIGVVHEKDNVVFNKDYLVYEKDNGSISQIPQVVHEKDNKNTNKNTKENNIYSLIFDYWISKNIKKHRKLTNDMKKAIDKTLKEYSKDEILEAINNYSTMYKDQDYQWCSYQWGLNEFLIRKDKDGIRQLGLFLNDGSKYINYLKTKEIEKNKVTSKQPGTNSLDYIF